MPPDRSDYLALGATLALDALTVTVVDALRRCGVRAIVLKGPAFLRLYDDRSRAYEDIDLLVSPDDLMRAEGILHELGFRFAAESIHARAWIRALDGVTVDLHRTLAGIGASDHAAWELLSASVARTAVGKAELEVFDDSGLALHAALHAAQHGERSGRTIDDLGRAIDRIDYEAWVKAAALASSLDATPALAAGLRMIPEGSLLAARLRLPAVQRVDVALGTASPPVTSRGLYRLGTTPGLRAKARLLAAEVAPNPTFMRAVYPVARRGPFGLAAAYAWRPVWLLWKAGPALRALLRARRPDGP